MGLPALEVNHDLLKRWLKLLFLRILVLGAHFLAVKDGMQSLGRYPILRKCLNGGPCPSAQDGNITGLVKLSKPVVKPGSVGHCSMTGGYKIDSHMFNFHMALFVLLGFYALAILIFLLECVVNFRLTLFPITQEKDACLNLVPTIWHKIRDATFNFATFPCDTIIMACIVGVYTSKRTAGGLGCWECYADPTCTTETNYEDILFLSSISLNLNMFLVLLIVFYKGFTKYFYATDPEKCDCHCVIPRCVTGCFVSLVTTCVIMMPPFITLREYYDLLGEDAQNLFSSLMGNMITVGMIIWIVMGAFIVIFLPLKCIMMRKNEKKPK